MEKKKVWVTYQQDTTYLTKNILGVFDSKEKATSFAKREAEKYISELRSEFKNGIIKNCEESFIIQAKGPKDNNIEYIFSCEQYDVL